MFYQLPIPFKIKSKENKELTHIFRQCDLPVMCVKFSPDGTIFAVGLSDGAIRVRLFFFNVGLHFPQHFDFGKSKEEKKKRKSTDSSTCSIMKIITLIMCLNNDRHTLKFLQVKCNHTIKEFKVGHISIRVIK